jgi:hypothetical protein
MSAEERYLSTSYGDLNKKIGEVPYTQYSSKLRAQICISKLTRTKGSLMLIIPYVCMALQDSRLMNFS